MNPTSLPFEYPFRWRNEELTRMAGVSPEAAALLEQRDRDLEGYLAGIQVFTASTRVIRTTAQSIPHGTHTYVQYQSESIDELAIADLSADPSRLTFRVAGDYVISATVQFAVSSAGGVREFSLTSNSDIAARNFGSVLAQDIRSPAGSETAIALVAVARMNVGSTLEAYVRHDAGSAINLNSPSGEVSLSVARMGT